MPKVIKKKKKKFSSFGDWILNDKDFVMPFLVTTSVISTVIIFIIASTMAWLFTDNSFIQWLFTIMLGASLWRMYKHYKFGGWRTLKGLTTNEIVWNGKVAKNGSR